jgi:hypothetical protein
MASDNRRELQQARKIEANTMLVVIWVTNSKAFSMSPPRHPFSARSQSISSCSDRGTSLPIRIALMPSMATTTENAQQLPHLPWFLTPVTAPIRRQSTDAGRYAKPSYMNPGAGLLPAQVVDARVGERGAELVGAHVTQVVEPEALGAVAVLVVTVG